jgi:hypothetical protein
MKATESQITELREKYAEQKAVCLETLQELSAIVKDHYQFAIIAKDTAGCLPENISQIRPQKYHSLLEFEITEMEVSKNFEKRPIWIS